MEVVVKIGMEKGVKVLDLSIGDKGLEYRFCGACIQNIPTFFPE
jgi:hypothetical protein